MRMQRETRIFGTTLLLLGLAMTVPASAELRTTTIRVQAADDVPPAPAAKRPAPTRQIAGIHKEARIDERDRDYIPHAFPWCRRIDCSIREFCPRGWCGEVQTECFRRDYARYVVRHGATDFSGTPLDIAYFRRYCRPCRDSFNRP
jgi:hypothetical protein